MVKINTVSLILLHAKKFSVYLFLLIFGSKSTFSIKPFRNTIRVSNSLDLDQARHFVEPDLGPNCLQMQMLSADDANM